VIVFATKCFLVLGFTLAISLWPGRSIGLQPIEKAGDAEAKAVAFLMREVPAWSKNNGCFSCHNNGDAARALYAATRKGYAIPAPVLSATTDWLSQPARWEANKGDPGFSDKRLANLQFAAALLAAVEAGQVKNSESSKQAAAKLLAEQGADGAWHIEPEQSLGSPATWGTPLATFITLKTLKQIATPETVEPIRRAERWLTQTAPNNVLTAATLLLATTGSTTGETRARRQEECLKIIRAAQTRDGGWGPFKDSPPEAFDTALVLLALAESREQAGIDELIRRGRGFLVTQQNADGSWQETTRPAGSESYAQRLSTTGWATLALLATR
jgi:hypothetical protein